MGTAPAAPRENALTPAAAPAPALSTPAGPENVPGARRARPGARGTWEHYRGALTSADFLFAALTALLTLASWLLSLAGGPPAVVAGLGIAGALAGGIPIAVGALRGLLAREMNVDELVTIAIGASIYVGEYWGAALVAFMMLFGKVLEDVTAARAEQALEGLGQLVPATAQVLDAAQPERTGGPGGRGGPAGERTVPVGDLRPGDVVLVRPGERVPVDGRVVSGRAAVEEAAITGESLPAEKGPGAEVFAGTLATGGALQVTTTRTGEGTALGRIATLVKEAEAERAPIVRTADRWARWFTPAVLALAGVVWLVSGELLPAVTVLVVACPCALVLATPTAIVAGVARGARSGILIKGGARLEAAGRVDAVCLDKTGTLTAGRPVLRRVIPFDGLSEHALLAYAAGAERLSEHPLSRAVLAGAA
ncbi:MAG TPA: HAD-IC family P-type ATPase, partial [Chloroflexota bacterium]|nr:HAD-IC family P-type ATPase [Chloroflexota bacterium]